MKRKGITIIIMVAVLVLCVFTDVALAADATISANDSDYNLASKGHASGDTITIAANCAVTLVGDSGTTYTNFKIVCGAGVSLTLSNVNIDNSSYADTCPLTFTGSGNTLTLADGTTSTLKGGATSAGVCAANGAELTIGGTGKLNATGGSGGAGIGGGDSVSGGTINISGGTITANGGSYYHEEEDEYGDAIYYDNGGAGIGGGYNGSDGTINISGGNITANGGAEASGIGGGYSGSGGTITISEDSAATTITAKGGSYYYESTGIGSYNLGGAGIGGGYSGSGGTIKIYGGDIKAYGGQCDNFNYSGAGIGGGGNSASGGSIEISGGDIEAYGGQSAAGIGTGSITITDGNITASGGNNGAGIGGSYSAACGVVTISGGEINTTGGGDGAGIGGGYQGSGGTIAISGGEINTTGGGGGAGIGGGYQGSGGTITVSGGNITATGKDGASGIGGGAGGTGGTITISEDSATTTITANGSSFKSGNYYNGGAGIGGGYYGSGGTIKIYGGHITATGGECYIYNAGGAGIGGGGKGSSGSIDIYGGDIHAYGGDNGGAGVGTGGAGHAEDKVTIADGNITITGGDVYAKGGDLCAGIGGGYFTSGGVITISGGMIETNGGYFGAGIGGGCYGDGGTITIEGTADVTAAGGSGAAGIGGGTAADDGGNIIISGGTVTATGNMYSDSGTDYSGAGIGGGAYFYDSGHYLVGGAAGSISISGGAIYASGATGAYDIGGGSGYTGTDGSLAISDTAAVFLEHDSCLTPTTTTHTHETFNEDTTSAYGLAIPSAWTPTFGAYLRFYTLTYDMNNGVGIAPQSVTQHIGTTAGVESVGGYTRTGYALGSGWNTKDDGTGDSFSSGGTFTFAANTTLYARWTAHTYTVKYDANGGSGTTAPSNHTYGVSKTLTANGFTRDHYTFAGWATSKDGNVVYADGQSVVNLTSADNAIVTLYAKWILDVTAPQPPTPAPVTVPVTISCSVADASLYSAANGNINITATGGNSGTYLYSIDGGAHWLSANSFSVAAGTYTAAACDATNNANSQIQSVTVGQPLYLGLVPAKKIAAKPNAGTALTIVPPAAPKGYTVVSVTYSSSNSAAASVDNSGNVTFLAGGKATITTKIVSQMTDSKGRVKTKTSTIKKKITVNQPVAAISLNLTDTTIARKAKVKLTALIAPATASNKKLKWVSSNPKVASVSSAGVVTGKAGGTAVITCTAKDGSGVSVSCTVTVTPIYPTGLKISKSALQLKLGKSSPLRATVVPSNTDFKTMTWVSSNPAVVSVDAKGKIKALASGTAVITATTSNGISASCTVTVP